MAVASALLRMELTVADLAASERFYGDALGFEALGRGDVPPALAALLGGRTVREARLRRGGQVIHLQQFDPPGAPYPARPSARDASFQHMALPVTDMRAAAARLPNAVVPISRGGPQRLPARSGGAAAFKFRDGDGHPLELIEFPDRRPGGIDHSAIVVADVERSIAFYRDRLGLQLQSRQTNTGAEQDRLDGLHDVTLAVVALAPSDVATPHLELLGYTHPPVRAAAPAEPADIVATRLVFAVRGLPQPELIADPDGHKLLLVPHPP